MKSQVKSAAPCHERAAVGSPKKVVQPRKCRLLNRLNRIEGQLHGVSRMVAEDRYCVDILTQISAIQAALRGAAVEILDDHARACLTKALRSGQGETEITELLSLLHRFTR